MSRRLKLISERKFSSAFALTISAITKLQKMSKDLKMSMSQIIERLIQEAR